MAGPALNLAISGDDVAAFARDGFLIRRRVVSDDMVERLRAEMERPFLGRYDRRNPSG